MSGTGRRAEIFLNVDWFYPSGFEVAISPSNAATWANITTAENRIQIIHASGLKDGTALTVAITAKS